MDEHGGNPLPPPTLESIRRNGVALKGPITTPVGGGFRSVNVALRKALDLYAQVRPCKLLSRRALALRRGRLRDHPGEHRGSLHRDRVRGGQRRREGADRVDRGPRRQAAPQGRRYLDQADLDHRDAEGRRVRVRLRASDRPHEDHGRPQGEHHEVHRRPLAGDRPPGGRREHRRRVRGQDRRQHVHAARAAPRGVRRPRPAEPLRRHPLATSAPA